MLSGILFDFRYSCGSEEKVLRSRMSAQLNAAASRQESACICLNVQYSGPRLPTNEEAVQYPWPVRWRLYVSVLIHSLDWRSHIEGIHLILQMRHRGTFRSQRTTQLTNRRILSTQQKEDKSFSFLWSRKKNVRLCF